MVASVGSYKRDSFALDSTDFSDLKTQIKYNYRMNENYIYLISKCAVYRY